MAGIIGVSILINLKFGQTTSLVLWSNGIAQLFFTTVCMIYYREWRELCLYCKYAIIFGNLHVAMLVMACEEFPWRFLYG